ncbi:MAG TPA: alpha/beta hydrolase [Trueperaceae bacterium]
MRRVRSKDGTVIAVEQCGDGPPVVLVGGAFNTRSSPVSGMPLARLLGSDFSVFTYDRRGRGDSGDAAPYAIERELEDLEEIFWAAGGTAHLYGHSSGAILALTAAANGLAVSKLAVYEPPIRIGPAGDLATRVAGLVSAGKREDAASLFMTEAVGMPPQMVAGMRDAPFWPGLAGLAHTLVYDLRITERFEMADASRITVPTLVIDGEKSPPTLREPAKALAGALPDGRLLSIPEQTHDVDIEALAPVLKEWFG